MRRVGYLLERIAEPENLREAFLRAARAKSAKPDVVAFRGNLAGNLAAMRGQILSGEVPVGGYRQFRVYDPKERVITVAPFAQRVPHQAILRVCEPYLENKLVPWTYACRKGKGRPRRWMRRCWRFWSGGGDLGGTTFALIAPARCALRAIFDVLPRHRPVPRLCRPTFFGRCANRFL